MLSKQGHTVGGVKRVLITMRLVLRFVKEIKHLYAAAAELRAKCGNRANMSVAAK